MYVGHTQNDAALDKYKVLLGREKPLCFGFLIARCKVVPTYEITLPYLTLGTVSCIMHGVTDAVLGVPEARWNQCQSITIDFHLWLRPTYLLGLPSSDFVFDPL